MPFTSAKFRLCKYFQMYISLYIFNISMGLFSIVTSWSPAGFKELDDEGHEGFRKRGMYSSTDPAKGKISEDF